MFVPEWNPNQRGAIAEAAITLAAIRAGVGVYRPLSEHARADLLFDIAGTTFRVQCKSAARRGDVLHVSLRSVWHSPVAGYVRRPYSPDEVDLIAAYAHELDRAYLIPLADVAGQQQICLRLESARNGQRASLHFAAEYEFDGAVAQLAERLAGSEEARGSNPLSSTDVVEESCTDVGAHEFRNHFGWYMERAAVGEVIRVNRRGKALVWLVQAGEARAGGGDAAARKGDSASGHSQQPRSTLHPPG